ncbi:peptide ligase PGM1-related protein [Mesorhizobium sp. M0040]|uniref:preATP grasp domain-containing protein n=1 Tax=Mesorhizobium sp. M0040 TaxID=2956855 RepID=UPI00333CAFAE
MTAVILANVVSEAIGPTSNSLSDDSLRANAILAKRMIWLAENDDILITPTPITRPFLDYTNFLKGGSDIVSLSTSPTPTERPLPISKKDLDADSPLSNSLSLLASDRILCLKPFIGDEVSICFAKFLGDVPVRFSNQNGRASPEATRLFNDKAKFRQFARSLGVPIASGSICVNEQEMVDSVCKVLSVSDHAILKMARNSAGDGNSVISKSAEGSLQGAMRSVSVLEVDDNFIRAAVHDIGLVATKKEPVIVEAYIENESSIGVHFDIGIDRVELVGSASILLNPGYGGTYWSKSLIDDLPNDVLSWCQNLGDYAQENGYFGPLSVDVVRGKEVGFFACEVNGRHGSFSLVRAVSNSLGLEPDIKDGKRVVFSRSAVPIGIGFPDLVNLLERRQLHFNSSSRRGVIVMSEGYEGNGPFDLLIVGSNLEDVKGIEHDVIKLSGT